MGPFEPFVAVRNGNVTAFASSLTFWPMAFGVAESDQDMLEAILDSGAAASADRDFVLPTKPAGRISPAN